MSSALNTANGPAAPSHHRERQRPVPPAAVSA